MPGVPDSSSVLDVYSRYEIAQVESELSHLLTQLGLYVHLPPLWGNERDLKLCFTAV